MRDERAILFVAFSHNRKVLRFADRVKRDLAAKGILAYRAIDDPRPGESLTARIHGAIDRADAILILWSELASESPKVRDEYDHARRTGRKPCLVRFPGVRLPEDWDPDLEWVPLEGVSFNFFGPVYLEPGYARMLQVIADFAFRERDRRRGAGVVRSSLDLP
jgi:hypothetical protein